MRRSTAQRDELPRVGNNQQQPSFSTAIARGALCGVGTGAVVVCADFLNAQRGDIADGQLRLILSLTSLLLPIFGTLGATVRAWLYASERCAALLPNSPAARPWFLALVSGLPLLAGAWWAPTSWLIDNAQTLPPQEQMMAVGVYIVLLLGVVLLCRLLWWSRDRYNARPSWLPWMHWPLCLLLLACASVCYWLDATLWVELYEDLHYALMGAYSLSLGAFVVACGSIWHRGSRWFNECTDESRSRYFGASILVICLLVLGVHTPPRIPSALVHEKIILSVQRHSDFDGDGHSAFLGGLDCAPLDASRSPREFDLPGNHVDEDCTGADAAWAQPAPARHYAVPSAHGFNLLLITIDTLRADRTSAFGHTRATTPNLERLARQGLAFSRAYAQGTKTFESLPSLFTGRYLANLPRDYGHPRVRGRKAHMYRMTGEVPTLTELLSERGYTTHAILTIDWLQHLGVDRGFERMEYLAEDISPKGTIYLRSARQPFFLWLHYLDPHVPYDQHPEFTFGERDIDRYDSEVAYVDAQIGQVLDELDRTGLADKTVVLVTADHGEEFREHGGEFHTNKLHEELLHVPLIIKVPGVGAARVDTPVELTDVAPTLCELFKLRPVCDAFDGQSLWAAVEGHRDESAGLRGAYSEAYVLNGTLLRRSLRTQEFRLKVSLDLDRVELFDVVQDPQELRDISVVRPEVVTRLREEMALRPYRRHATAFEAATHGDTRALVLALPQLRSESLLRSAVKTILEHPSPGSVQALEQLKQRPGLGAAVRSHLK